LLSGAHAKARDILVAHRSALEESAKLLLEKEVVDRPALPAILKVRSIASVKDKRKSANLLESGSWESVIEGEKQRCKLIVR
jgi:hypothetical protein